MKNKRFVWFKLNTGAIVLATVSGQEEPHPVIYRNLTQAERKAKEVGGTVYQSRFSRSNFYVTESLAS